MSQFHDTFTRGSRTDPLLSYDDFASRVFTSGFLACFLVPITIYCFYQWTGPKRNSLPQKLKLRENHVEGETTPCFHCGCSMCRQRRTAERNRRFMLEDYMNTATILKVVVLAFFWWLVFYLIKGIDTSQNIKTFDPFAFLGVPIGATKKDIQKAYRHMSLRYHPDRNPNDPEAAAHFILVTKAYKTLTNDKFRQNYERYGNPDGPGMMKIGIGLPRFLVEVGNQVLILSLFFIVLLVVIPGIFFYYYRTQKQYTALGVRVETLQLIYYGITENTRQKTLPEIYASAMECISVPATPEDDVFLRQYAEDIGDIKRKNFTKERLRNFLVLLCHMNRSDDLPPKLKATQAEILKYSMLLTQCMLDVALCRRWLMTTKSIIEFRRCLLQGLTGKRDTFFQIPHLTEDCVGHIQRSKGGGKTISEYVKTPMGLKKGLVGMNEKQLTDVDEFCKAFPQVDLNVDVYVNDANDICVGDIITFEVTITRANVPEECQIVGPVHAPFFPWVKYEEWVVLLTYGEQDDKLLGFSICPSRERVITEKISVFAEKPGLHSVSVTVMSDSYFGCDQSKKVTFTVNTPSETTEFKIHPEDLALDNEPSAIGKMLGDLLGEGDSDEEEEVMDD
ncbi:DnaJ domain containing protein, putative [Babesia bigemina]|uniref:DnaJ domain containing protein, putative n=1 Tax=Babesia bigemina TaxID=5866 RepID=A0A061D236_BABBI|nr:DnaJ domain containing protein, putative [Babesia bigemina]CDR94182.1 DnaJ domain containing protein, putative [Babesia bigemina]|eukprot:XP_012766368.1 DnaJ domain containing protein, putative [Babesia bigemina]